MPSKPRIEIRPEQPYVGIRTTMPMSDFEREMPTMQTKIAQCLGAEEMRASGPPFLRYHVIDMPGRMDIEIGMPVTATAPMEDASLQAGVLPAGRYAVLNYTGLRNGVAANKTLLDWASERGELVLSHKVADGQAFEARLETYLTDPDAEPDQGCWEIEVAMKLRD